MQPIPVANIYYLLCYAWDVLKEARLSVPVGALDSPNLQELFARVLISGTRAMMRRGLDRGYQPRRDEIAGIRGKLLLTETYRRNLPAHARAACEWDELEFDTLPNRILKATLRELHAGHDLERTLRDALHDLLRWFAPVQDIRLAPQHFRRVQLHGNNRAYALLLHICEFIHEQTLPDEQDRQTGGRRFRDFERDALPKLFEKFVLNFYRRELPDWEVESHGMKWDRHDENDDARRYLPDMQTDICLRNPRANRAIILDTKFYANALASGRHGAERLSSGNLYQLFTYLRQRSRETGWEAAEGILLYPKNEYEFDASFTTHGHRMRAVTLDLAQPWRDISYNLKNIILYAKPYMAPNYSLRV